MSDTDTPPAIPPFWHRLNKFFLFPMQTEALLYAFSGTCAWLLITFGLAIHIIKQARPTAAGGR